MPHFATKTDAGATPWRIVDAVIRLREWASDNIHVLPPQPANGILVGSASSCALRLIDPSGRISREHAQLERRDVGWVMRDLASKNGIRLDGSRVPEILLEPGAEVTIGGLRLLAESRLYIELRSFLSRLLGWGSEQLAVVDTALRLVRLAATRRVPLVLCGDEDMAQIAASIHRHVLGPDRPFVTSDPRRGDAGATVRSARNAETGMTALQRARGGTLCVFTNRLPADFPDVRQALADPATEVQLIVCADKPRTSKRYHVDPIMVPPLSSRRAEILRIIVEYAEDAAVELAATARFGSVDRDWVLKHCSTSVSEIEKGTRRLLAIRQHGYNLAAAARALGMAATSLSDWIGRRALPGWRASSTTSRPGKTPSQSKSRAR